MMLKMMIVIYNDDVDDAADDVDKDWDAGDDIHEYNDFVFDEGYVRCC